MTADEQKVQPKPKQNCSNKFDQPTFEGRRTVQTEYTRTDGTTATTTLGTLRAKGIPNANFLHKHHLNKDSLPVKFVDALLPMCKNKVVDSNGDAYLSMEMIARNTNVRATMAFAGEAQCAQCSGPFDVKEIRQCLGLYIINGLGPSPGLERKFRMPDHLLPWDHGEHVVMSYNDCYKLAESFLRVFNNNNNNNLPSSAPPWNVQSALLHY